jgi:hypothetical protein
MDRLFDLSRSARTTAEFYPEFLRVSLYGSDAPAGAVWLKSPDGFLRQQCQQNVEYVGLDDRTDGRAVHNQLLRFAFEQGRPGLLGPRQRAESDRSAGNPTDYLLAVAPILGSDRRAVGLVEIFHLPSFLPQDLVTYAIKVTEYASWYTRSAP